MADRERRDTASIAVALALAVTPVWTIWHVEVALLNAGVGCGDMGALSNGLWSAPACAVYHLWMYALLAVCWTAAYTHLRQR